MPTPFYADKSWWLVVMTLVAVLLTRYLKLEVSAADLAGVAAMVGAYVFASKNKQAREIEAKLATMTPEERKKLHDELEAMDKATPPSGEKGEVEARVGLLGGLSCMILAVALAALMGATGCTTIKRIGRTAELAAPEVLDCVGEACKQDFPVLMGIAAKELMKVVAGGSFDVEPVIDNLIGTAKNPTLMACVIEEVLKAWEQAGAGAGISAPTSLEDKRLMFIAAHVGQTHLLARGYVPK